MFSVPGISVSSSLLSFLPVYVLPRLYNLAKVGIFAF